jgi:RNA polymerase sigma-70 factor (ECF subfamily)
MLTRVWPRTRRPEALVALDATVTRTKPTDADLVHACLQGDRTAFDTIVERHQRAIYRVCYRFAETHEDASDLAQDVFVRAYRSLATFKGQASLTTWLYRIAINVGLNHAGARRPAIEPIGTAANDLPSKGEPPVDAVLRGERAEQVRAAIRRLPRKQRATLILRAYHDLPHDQIADVLGTSVGAVKVNFFHALNNLRKLLRDV